MDLYAGMTPGGGLGLATPLTSFPRGVTDGFEQQGGSSGGFQCGIGGGSQCQHGGISAPLASYPRGITAGFEVQQGDLDGGGNAADDLQFDYTAGRSPEPDESQATTTTVTTPQQAQAELGAMLQDLQRLQQQQQHQHVSAQSSSSLAQMELSGGDSTGYTFIEEHKSGAPPPDSMPAPTSPDFNNTMADENNSASSGGADDPLSFPSMNRGASNIQAALDELQSQESNPQQVMSPQHAQQQLAQQQQQMQHQHSQHARHAYYSSRHNGPPPPLPRELSHSQHSQASASEYDGEYQHSQSQYSEHGGESEHEHDGHDSEYTASHYSRQEIDGSKYPQPFSLQITGVGNNGQLQPPQQIHPITFNALSHHNASHYGSSHGHHSSHGGHHGGHHSHHHHSHSHSVAPTVPPVEEDAEDGEVAAAQSARRTQIMQQQQQLQQQAQGHPSTLLMLDAAYLPSMQAGAQQQQHSSSHHLPATLHPAYARSTSASSVTSGRASGGTSPNPGSSSAASTAARKSPLPPSASSSGNTPGTYMLSPTASAPGRRHSGHLERLLPTLHPPAALSPSPHQPLQPLPPQREHRMIGRSPSADSLHLGAPRPMVPAQPLSGGALSRTHSFTQSPSPGPSGSRELHLHPSPSQLQARCEQMQQQQSYHAAHQHAASASPPHSLHMQLHGASSTASSASSVSSSDHLPSQSLAPIGRSFSLDHMHAVKTEHAYYSDGGYYSQSSSGAVSPVPHAHHSHNHSHTATSTAVHRFGLGPQLHLDETSVLQSIAHSTVHHHPTHAAASSGYASTTSSGAATPLRGPCGSPGAMRGSNSMNDLHHLLMLHAAGGERGVTTLMPLKANSHSHTSAHASAAASAGSSDRIGSYTREERARRLARYKDKRQRRCFTKRVLYQVRKDFAVSRKRVGGRFIKKENPSCSCPDVCLESQ